MHKSSDHPGAPSPLSFLFLLAGILACQSGTLDRSNQLHILSVDPPSIVEGALKTYTIRGTGFTPESRVFLSVRAFVGAAEDGPSSNSGVISEDGKTLSVFIRPYGHLHEESIHLTVVNQDYESSIAIPVSSHHDNIRALVDHLSLDELIGQTLMIGFDALQDEVNASNRGLIQLVSEYPIGGVILFKHNLPRPQDTESIPEWAAALTQDLQRAAYLRQPTNRHIPLLIAVDQEGGSGNILRGNEVTHFPDPAAIAVTRQPSLSRAAGLAVGKELRYLGITMNLAPVGDVVTTEYSHIEEIHHNPTIGMRSFGAHVDIVEPMAVEFMKGLQEAGVLSVMKHYPGHGSSLLDPHKVLPKIEYSTEQDLHNVDLKPFKSAIRNGVNGLLTSHIIVPPWGATAVTFSDTILTERTRRELNFGGLLISDDLSTMEGILRSETTPTLPAGREVRSRTDAIRLAHKAGHDILILGHIYPQSKLQEEAYAGIRRIQPIVAEHLPNLIAELRGLYSTERAKEELRARVARILYQKAVAFGHNNFENLDEWTSDFNRSEYKGILHAHRGILESIVSESVVLLSEFGEIRDRAGKFQYFAEGEGPLSPGRGLIGVDATVALGSPVFAFSREDEFLQYFSEAADGIVGQIRSVPMYYGAYSRKARDQAREFQGTDEIEVLTITDDIGNFRYDLPEIDAALNRLADRLLVAWRTSDVLVLSIVTQPQIEVLHRLLDRRGEDGQISGSKVIVLLAREPYLLASRVYQDPRVLVLHFSPFPDFKVAADVLFGQVMPKPAAYSSLNGYLLPISRTSGAPMQAQSRPEYWSPRTVEVEEDQADSKADGLNEGGGLRLVEKCSCPRRKCGPARSLGRQHDLEDIFEQL